MRLLLDENLPVSLVQLLKEWEDWDALHVRTLGMQSSPDAEVLAVAAADGRVPVSADTDFGTLLAASAADGPSVGLLRIGSGRRAERIAALLGANLPRLREDLADGALVVITDQRVRIRQLPIG